LFIQALFAALENARDIITGLDMQQRLQLSRRSVIRGIAAGTLTALARNALAQSSDIVPFRYAAPDAALADLRQRLLNTRLPRG